MTTRGSRKFDGKMYQFSEFFHSRAPTAARARKLRAQGYAVHTVEFSDGWAVYKRFKGGKR